MSTALPPIDAHRYRVASRGATVRMAPQRAAPITRRLKRGAHFWGVPVGMAGRSRLRWVLRLQGGYVLRAMLDELLLNNVERRT